MPARQKGKAFVLIGTFLLCIDEEISPERLNSLPRVRILGQLEAGEVKRDMLLPLLVG